MIRTKYKVGQKGKIYKSKNKKGYSLRNAKIKAKRVKKQVQKANMTNRKLELQRIKNKAKAGKKRIAKQRKKDSDIKRKNWIQQTKNKEKYEKRKKKAIAKRRRESYSKPDYSFN